MSVAKLWLLAVLCPGFATAQSGSPVRSSFAPQTTLPVVFTKTVDANHAKAGDAVFARTLQTVRLADRREVKAGAQVLGHVLTAQGFAYDKAPYAKQKQAVLEVQFDSLTAGQGDVVPLHVSLRAMADSFASTAAYEPRPSDEDSLQSTVQVGGDVVTPSQSEVTNQHGDVVGYNKHGGVYAHLIASTSAAGVGQCDGSGTEQSMGTFSASACGLYGFPELNLTATSFGPAASSFTLVSSRRTPEVHRGSTALLEVASTTNVALASH